MTIIFLTQAPHLRNHMKQILKIKLNKYKVGATDLNKVGLFARVAPFCIPVNVVLGGNFYSRNLLKN